MNLQKAIQHCLSEGYGTRECRFIIKRAHTIALAYLRLKAVSGHLYTQSGERLEDLAWDYIADLFERDHNDVFTVLRKIFGDFDFTEASKAETEQHFRRIIVTKVNDNIFRANGDFDPSLKKIIRNLKNAIVSGNIDENVAIEDGYLMLKNVKREGSFRPVKPSEVLEKQLCSRITETMQTPEVLQEAVFILKESRMFDKKISLTALAICIRKAFVHVQKPDGLPQNRLSAESELHAESLEFQLEKASLKIRNKLGEKYLKRKVLDEETLNCFLDASKAIIREEFSEEHADGSQFELLEKEMPGLTHTEFRDKYRGVLEYIVKKMRAGIIDFYQKDWIKTFSTEDKVQG